MKTRLFTLASTVAAVGVIVLSGCARLAPTPAPVPSKTLDFGVATPITGQVAWLGGQTKTAIMLATEDQNKLGGVTIAGQKYILNPIIRDTKNDIVLAKSATEELVFDKKVKFVDGLTIADAVGAQTVTEPNKVIMFGMLPVIPQMTGPDKPYTFFKATPAYDMYQGACAYIQKFYPQARTVMSMVADLPDSPVFTGAAQTMCPKYGLNWLGFEKVPADTRDFMPIISRVLLKNSDVIDTASLGGAMGGMTGLLIKQLRQAGFNGLIMIPASPPPGVIEQAVPQQYLNKIITRDIDPNAAIVNKAYRDVFSRAKETLGGETSYAVAVFYDPLRAFFKFLDGQDTMDTTAWIQGLEKYKWTNVYGDEATWIGKPIWKINRMVLGPTYVSEYTNGKMETKWAAPRPMEFYTGQ